MDLPTIWFAIIAVLWFGYLFLECFDMGVGMHIALTARNQQQRRLILNSIGPVWDGNEVWLITAGAAIFAAFPNWYASLFSGLYLPLVIVLLALIVRAISIEYRSKHHTVRWVRFWDTGHAVAALVASFGVGAMLAITTTGLPIDEYGDRVGGPLAWLSFEAVIGGLALVFFSLVHGALFLSLKAAGDVRQRARAFYVRWLPLGILPLVLWVLIVQFRNGTGASWALTGLAAVAALTAWTLAIRHRMRASFLGMGVFLAAGVAAIFSAAYPAVLPSTIDPAFTLTVENASSSDYTLGVMSVVALLAVPAVIATQAWSYWVFSRRLSERHMPELHEILPATRTEVPREKEQR